MPIDQNSSKKAAQKAAKQAYKSAITPMGVYRLLDTRSGRSVISADRNLPSVMGRFRFLMSGGGAQPGGPFSDPELYRDYTDHPDAFTFEVLEAVEIEKCATYEEAADQLAALLKAAQGKYADWPQYVQK